MILLTGATGFIGKHIQKALIKIYGKKNIVVLTSTPMVDCNYLLHNDYIFDNDYFVKSGYGDIETLIHAGAYTPKSGIESNDIVKCNSNINSTAKLLEANLPNLKKFIFLSTLDVYGVADIITEGTLVSPNSLYGHSKNYCEHMVSTWGKMNDINHQILRIGHVYGEGEEKYRKIIPITMERLLENKPIEIYGEGDEIRSFIYISDVVNAIVSSITINENVGIINVVGDEQISINKLINEIVLISGKSPKINKIEINSFPRNLVFDNSKMKKYLSIPQVSLAEGLRREWNYMKNLYL